MSAWAYYNEIDPGAAAWLRNLIACGLIAPGIVDTRSITEVEPDDLEGFTQVHLFAGIGGWSRAARLAGWPDDRPIWSASCPCQPFSVAGKGAGRDDPRHLWPHVIRLAGARRPLVIVGEQVAGKAGYDWFDGVAADLEAGGYACRAVDVPACAVDAPHIRSRQYWVAVADTVRAGRDAAAYAGVCRGEEGAGARHGSAERLHGSDSLDVADGQRHGGRADFARRGSEGRAVAGRADGEGGMADATDAHGGRRQLFGPGEGGGTDAERPSGQLAGRDDGPMVNPPRLGRGEGRPEPELRGGRSAAAGAVASGVMGNALGPRLEGHRGHGDNGTGRPEPGRSVAAADGGAREAEVAHAAGMRPQEHGVCGARLSVEPIEARGIGHNSAAGGFWSDHEWLICHDGKARRTKPGLPLLAHGIRGGVAVLRPDGLGVESPEGFPALQEETRLISRVAAWKGFGNAIVPQLAAEVIGALSDTLPPHSVEERIAA